jgi:ribonuclease P protein component
LEKARKKGRFTLRTHAEFQRVYSSGIRFYRGGLAFCVRKSKGLVFRFGISVPKKWGKAVERNLLRRRLREIIRRSDSLPDNAEIVFCIKKPCQKLSFLSLKDACDWAFSKIRQFNFEREIEPPNRETESG